VLFCIVLGVYAVVPKLATFNVMDYGAHADGKTLDTKPIQMAIKAAEEAGGGNVYFPEGNYLTGPFNLTSNMVLQLNDKAVILAAQDMSLYNIIPAFPSYGVGRDVGPDNYEPVVGGYNLTNVEITGGTIDGQGNYWWSLFRNKQLKHSRPALVQFQYTSGLKVVSTLLKDSPFWNLHPLYCDDVYIARVVIRAPQNSPNTDGIDVDSSSNVLIEQVDLATGDDMIAIKSGMNMPGIHFGWPTENVLIRDSLFANGHGISVGSETSGGIRNITFQNVTVINAGAGPRIKTSRGRGGVIEELTYKNITVSGCTNDVMEIGMNYDNVPTPGNKTTTPIVRKVYFGDINADCKTPGKFICLPESPCTEIRMENVIVKDSTSQFQCQYISGTSSHVQPPACFSNEISVS